MAFHAASYATYTRIGPLCLEADYFGAGLGALGIIGSHQFKLVRVAQSLRSVT